MGETCTAVFLFAEIMENYTKNEKFLQLKEKNRAFRFFFASADTGKRRQCSVFWWNEGVRDLSYFL